LRNAGLGLTEALTDLVKQLELAQGDVDAEVDRLVAACVSWPVIAAALGVSRQAARQRWLRRHS
jgi:hypothetical protein